jgi:pyridoxal 5'-phosphate synthase pdxS subunit
METGTFRVKAGLAEMLKGGVIMDVVTPEQAKIAEDAGAAAVMALERVPADIRRDGGVARMSDPTMIEGIKEAVSIPVMAKARIGHFVEAQVLEALEVDYIDESEVLTPADEAHHIDKWAFKVPFVCGATNLGEALRRIAEGAAMIRSKGEAGTGNVVEAVRHIRLITGEIRRLQSLTETELPTAAKFTTGSFPVRATSRTSSYGAARFFASAISSSSDMLWRRRIWDITVRICVVASTILPVPASPLVRIIAAPSAIRRSASPRSRAPHTKGTVKAHLSMWNSSSAGVRTSDSSM